MTARRDHRFAPGPPYHLSLSEYIYAVWSFDLYIYSTLLLPWPTHTPISYPIPSCRPLSYYPPPFLLANHSPLTTQGNSSQGTTEPAPSHPNIPKCSHSQTRSSELLPASCSAVAVSLRPSVVTGNGRQASAARQQLLCPTQIMGTGETLQVE